MKVHLQHNWVRMGYDITFYERDPSLRVMRFTGSPWPKWEQANEAENFPPTLHLPGEALEALLAETEKVIPASHATERHLTDAVAVRDRLLELVEKGWDQP